MAPLSSRVVASKPFPRILGAGPGRSYWTLGKRGDTIGEARGLLDLGALPSAQRRGEDDAIRMRETWSLLRATGSDWYEDRAQRLGAALAYYTIFALTPGLIIVIAVTGFLLGRNAELQIVGQIRELIARQVGTASEQQVASRPSRNGRDRHAGGIVQW